MSFQGKKVLQLKRCSVEDRHKNSAHDLAEHLPVIDLNTQPDIRLLSRNVGEELDHFRSL